MKKIIYTLALLGLTAQLKAADLTVQENGPVGTYGSITSAITAAVNGDRIIIHPKIGQNAWVENISISKSLELVSSEDTVRYKVLGDITINGQNGRLVSIGGVDLSGNILGAGNSWKTIVNIFGSEINGSIDFYNGSTVNGFNLNVIGNVINGVIQLTSGEVIGNQITANNLNVQVFNNSVPDSINVIGNKIYGGSLVLYGTSSANLTYINCRNNLISSNQSSNSDFISISCSKLLFINNTVSANNSSADIDLYSSNIPVYINNVFYSSFTGSGDVIGINGSHIASANYYFGNTTSPSTTSPGFNLLSSNPLDGQGELILGSQPIDGADASFEYYDLDLTRGDAGCFGGSYSLDNYFPITGSSRVYDVDMPFGLTTGGTINIKAKGVDR